MSDLIGRTGAPLHLQGLIVPYGEKIVVDGAPESFDPGAYDRQYPKGKWTAGVPLMWKHENFVVCDAHRVSVLNGEFGLWFDAALPDDAMSRHVAAMARSGHLGASMLFHAISAPRADGVVTRARLESVG
ncbi:hypothetical protein HH303_18340, partial [Rhodospirillaceae bacterium KN72]